MKLLVFAASHRPASVNRRLAKMAQAHVEAKGAHVDFAEYGEFDMPIYNDDPAELEKAPASVNSFAHRASKADGIILSSPEYNWSYPGSIKNIIDWTSRLRPNPVMGRTVLLMSATPGMRGGVVGLSHLKTPMEALQLFVFPKVFLLGDAHNAIGADEFLREEKQRKLFTSILDDYMTFTHKLSIL